MSTFIFSKLSPDNGTSHISISKYSKSLHFKVWSMAQKLCHHLGVCEKCRISGPT